MALPVANVPPRLLKLHHIHLPYLTSYPLASKLQEHFVRQQLDSKTAFSPPFSPPSPTNNNGDHLLDPVLITFQTLPTYTCGRRDVSSLPEEQIAHLRHGRQAAFHPALRGGQTTFHGPGQLTAYVICALKAHNLRLRSYVRFLEQSVVTLLEGYGLKGYTREKYLGVWVRGRREEGSGGMEHNEQKIASLGVHMQRMVSSHGVGINIGTHLDWFRRIEACGLPGEVMTNMLDQGAELEFGDAVKNCALGPQDIRHPIELGEHGGNGDPEENDQESEFFERIGMKTKKNKKTAFKELGIFREVIERSEQAVKNVADRYAQAVRDTLPNLEGKIEKPKKLPYHIKPEVEEETPIVLDYLGKNMAGKKSRGLEARRA